jgi:hypothetical protein
VLDGEWAVVELLNVDGDVDFWSDMVSVGWVAI